MIDRATLPNRDPLDNIAAPHVAAFRGERRCLGETLKTTRRTLFSILGAAALATTPAGAAALASLTSRPLETEALRLLLQTQINRPLGRPRDNAWCRIELDDVYVQALAPHDTDTIILEAVSPRFAPKTWSVMAAARIHLLTRLGFRPPTATNPNYALECKIDGDRDLQSIAKVTAVVLNLGFGIRSAERARSTLGQPSNLVIA